MSRDDAALLKVMTVGDGAAGKTCMLLKYTTGQFPDKYVPTVFDAHSHHMSYQNQSVRLGLFDTGDGEDYPSLRPLEYPQTDVFFLLFSIEWSHNLDPIKSYWIPEIRHHCPGVPVVLIGSKIDLRSKSKDAVRRDQGKKMAAKIGAAKYMEISSLQDKGLTELFEEVTRIGLQHYTSSTKPQKQRKCMVL